MGGGVPALKFRSDNHSELKALNSLEDFGLIKRENDLYRLQSSALPLLDAEPALRVMSDIERVYGVLQARYRQTQQTHVLVISLAAEAQLTVPEVAAALQLMLDTTLWHAGHSGDLLRADSFVSPAEAILDHASFAAMAKEVRTWNSNRQPRHALRVGDEAAGQDEPRPSDNLRRAWPAARACLQEFSFYEIKEVAGLAGFDVTTAAHLVQRPQKGASKGELMSAIDEQVGQMDAVGQKRFLTFLIEEILRRRPEAEEKLAEYLSRLGWSFVSGTLIPTAEFDIGILSDTPSEAHRDLVKAAQRMRDGDLGGAISAACGAVDAATSKVYEEFDLGDPTKASFQERCKKAAMAKGVLTKLDHQLEGLGWRDADVMPFKRNLEGALNQGAYVMQTLRSRMGDVHGTKPILRTLAFDCLRWSELIVGSLVNRPD